MQLGDNVLFVSTAPFKNIEKKNTKSTPLLQPFIFPLKCAESVYLCLPFFKDEKKKKNLLAVRGSILNKNETDSNHYAAVLMGLSWQLSKEKKTSE